MNKCILSNLLRARKICKTFVPYKNRCITYSLLKQTRYFSDISPKKLTNEEPTNENENDLVSELTSKHKIFHDKDSKVILDVEEEQKRILLEDLRIEEEQEYDPYSGLNLKRGIYGVYDIEDLIMVLRKDNAKNIFVVSVPKENIYVDYMVIVTGKSQKHMSALATYVRKVYKLKMHKKDIIPKIEGAKSKDWIALDLGNIALHIFSAAARKQYDLETLWAVGSQYDNQTNKPMEADIMEQYNSFLDVFQPENP